MGVDETSFQKRHEYVTLTSDLERGRVLYVGDDRTQTSLDAFWLGLPREHLLAVEAVAMDMCAPYIQSTLLHLPAADEKIVFDKFHIMKHLGEAVDLVRRAENRELRAAGDERLANRRRHEQPAPLSTEPEATQ